MLPNDPVSIINVQHEQLCGYNERIRSVSKFTSESTTENPSDKLTAIINMHCRRLFQNESKRFTENAGVHVVTPKHNI